MARTEPQELTYFLPQTTFPSVPIDYTRGQLAIKAAVPLTLAEHWGKYRFGSLEWNLWETGLLNPEEPLSFRRKDNDPVSWELYQKATRPEASASIRNTEREVEARVDTEDGALIGTRALYLTSRGAKAKPIGVYIAGVPLPSAMPIAWMHLTEMPNSAVYRRNTDESANAKDALLDNPLAPLLNSALSIGAQTTRVEVARLFFGDAKVTVVHRDQANEAELEAVKVKPDYNGWKYNVLNDNFTGGRLFQMPASLGQWYITIERRKKIGEETLLWREEQSIPNHPDWRDRSVLPQYLRRVIRSLK